MSEVVKKLAKGHVLYELHENCAYDPDEIIVLPLSLMSDLERQAFSNPPPPNVYPEVGSRAMHRVVIEDGIGMENGVWIEVQPSRYRYCVSADHGVAVRIIIQEYLACYVRWKH